MSIINRSKWGDCSACPAVNTNVVKVGRDLFCFNCNTRAKNKIQITKANERNLIRRLHNQNPANPDVARDREMLERFYDNAAKEIDKDPRCWNCGAEVHRKYYRAATAHIYPKAIFKSIQAHPLNYLVLPASCCHNLTHRLDTFYKMGIWVEAVNRFREFEPLITESHKYLHEFREYAERTYPQARPDNILDF